MRKKKRRRRKGRETPQCETGVKNSVWCPNSFPLCLAVLDVDLGRVMRRKVCSPILASCSCIETDSFHVLELTGLRSIGSSPCCSKTLDSIPKNRSTVLVRLNVLICIIKNK